MRTNFSKKFIHFSTYYLIIWKSVTFKKTQKLLKLLFSKRIIIFNPHLHFVSQVFFKKRKKEEEEVFGIRFFYEKKKIKYTFFIFLYTEMT